MVRIGVRSVGLIVVYVVLGIVDEALGGVSFWYFFVVVGCVVGYIVFEIVETLVCGTRCIWDGRR